MSPTQRETSMIFELTRETNSGRLDWEGMTEWEFGTAIDDAMGEAIMDGLPLVAMVGGNGPEVFIVFDPKPNGQWSLREYFPHAWSVDRETRHAAGRVVDMMRDFVDNGCESTAPARPVRDGQW
jgi:hypothetical protein